MGDTDRAQYARSKSSGALLPSISSRRNSVVVLGGPERSTSFKSMPDSPGAGLQKQASIKSRRSSVIHSGDPDDGEEGVFEGKWPHVHRVGPGMTKNRRASVAMEGTMGGMRDRERRASVAMEGTMGGIRDRERRASGPVESMPRPPRRLDPAVGVKFQAGSSRLQEPDPADGLSGAKVAEKLLGSKGRWNNAVNRVLSKPSKSVGAKPDGALHTSLSVEAPANIYTEAPSESGMTPTPPADSKGRWNTAVNGVLSKYAGANGKLDSPSNKKAFDPNTAKSQRLLFAVESFQSGFQMQDRNKEELEQCLAVLESETAPPPYKPRPTSPTLYGHRRGLANTNYISTRRSQELVGGPSKDEGESFARRDSITEPIERKDSITEPAQGDEGAEQREMEGGSRRKSLEFRIQDLEARGRNSRRSSVSFLPEQHPSQTAMGNPSAFEAGMPDYSSEQHEPHPPPLGGQPSFQRRRASFYMETTPAQGETVLTSSLSYSSAREKVLSRANSVSYSLKSRNSSHPEDYSQQGEDVSVIDECDEVGELAPRNTEVGEMRPRDSEAGDLMIPRYSEFGGGAMRQSEMGGLMRDSLSGLGDEGEESALSAAMKRQRLTRRVSQRQMLERANPGAFSIEAKAQQDLKLMAAADMAQVHLEALDCSFSSASAKNAEKEFKASLASIQTSRPFFVPAARKNQPVAIRADRRLSMKSMADTWIENCIFQGRAKEESNESQSMVDTQEVLDKQFQLDYQRVAKESFKIYMDDVVTNQHEQWEKRQVEKVEQEKRRQAERKELEEKRETERQKRVEAEQAGKQHRELPQRPSGKGMDGRAELRWEKDQMRLKLESMGVSEESAVTQEQLKKGETKLQAEQRAQGERLRQQQLQKEIDEAAGSSMFEELQKLKAELRKRAHIIRSCFIFYASVIQPTRTCLLMVMQAESFKRFLRDCAILDKDSGSCTVDVDEVDAIFESVVSVETTGNAVAALKAKGKCLHRYEFMECLIRIAIAKYMNEHAAGNEGISVATIVTRLFDDNIEPHLPPSAKVDPNTFRTSRLYTRDMEAVLMQRWEFLQAIFNMSKVRSNSNILFMDSWLKLLTAGNLGKASITGIDRNCAKLVFLVSQTAEVDELKDAGTHVGLSFFDFIEALARLSEVLSPPTLEDVARLIGHTPDRSANVVNCVAQYFQALPTKPDQLANRISAAGLDGPLHEAAKQRPMVELFESLMELMLSSLCTIWGAESSSQLMDMLKDALAMKPEPALSEGTPSSGQVDVSVNN